MFDPIRTAATRAHGDELHPRRDHGTRALGAGADAAAKHGDKISDEPGIR